MNFITKVTIENFQSHEFTEIDFSSGLNVITGPSDQGKSAILRAIKWVLYNEPRGTEFIRHGASFARVAVELSNGNTIIRERSSSNNKYILTDSNGESHVFQGFGNDIPSEIVEAHGIYKAVVDTDVDTTLNISDQLESPFLLFQTGAVRAKALGKLTGAHIIDLAIRNCITDIRRETQNETRTGKELEEINASISAFSNLNDLQYKISILDKIISEIKHLTLRLEKCIDIYDAYTYTIKNISYEMQIFKRTQNITEFQELYEQIKSKLNIIGRLVEINKSKKKVFTAIDAEMRVIQHTKHIDEFEKLIIYAEDMVRALEKNTKIADLFNAADNEEKQVKQYIEKLTCIIEIYENVNDRARKVVILDELKCSMGSIEKSIAEGQNYIKDTTRQLNSYVDSFTKIMKTVGKCPMCLGDIDDDTIEKISLNYKEENR